MKHSDLFTMASYESFNFNRILGPDYLCSVETLRRNLWRGTGNTYHYQGGIYVWSMCQA